MSHGNERIIKHITGLLNLEQALGNVSRTCQAMGLSRDTFYCDKSAVESSGIETLIDKNRRKPNPKGADSNPTSLVA